MIVTSGMAWQRFVVRAITGGVFLLRNDGGLVDAPGSWLAGTKREYPPSSARSSRRPGNLLRPFVVSTSPVRFRRVDLRERRRPSLAATRWAPAPRVAPAGGGCACAGRGPSPASPCRTARAPRPRGVARVARRAPRTSGGGGGDTRRYRA